MKKFFTLDTLTSIFLVSLGSFIFAATINMIVIPNHFGEGGVTGITLILYYVFHISPALSSLVLNAFLLIVGYRFLDSKRMTYTILSVLLLSLFLSLTKSWYQFVPQSQITAAVTAGTLMGGALGIVMLGNGTTAGSDIVAMMAKKYLGWNVSMTLLLIDVLVVTPLSLVIGLENAIVTLIMLFVASKMINFVLEGFNPKKSVFIISKHYQEIGTQITQTIGRGTTILQGQGFYSKEERRILFVVVNRLQIMPLQRLVHDIDPAAFMTITDVNQVIGEGFSFYLDAQGNRV